MAWLYHYWPHHLVVLMSQNMAMVQESWEFDQLLFWDLEISMLACLLCSKWDIFWEICTCPSYPNSSNRIRLYPYCVFPTLLIFFQKVCIFNTFSILKGTVPFLKLRVILFRFIFFNLRINVYSREFVSNHIIIFEILEEEHILIGLDS